MASGVTPSLRVELDDRGTAGRVATMTVDNPEKLNILDSTLNDAIIESLATLKDDETLRAVVLTGAGDRAMIGGADIREMAGLDPASAREFIARLHRVCQGFRSLPVPVIARISGYCLGAGLEVAASCDMRVATQSSAFGMPEVRVGIPSVIEAALLPQLVGWGKTRELVFTGRIMQADEALRCGLIDRVVPLDGLDDAVQEWLDGILSAGPRAIRLQKSLIRRWEEVPVEAAIEEGIATFGEAYTTEEPRVFMERFLNRGKADPKGGTP